MKLKKTIILLTLLLASLSIQAQQWHGIVELFAGTSPAKSDLNFQSDGPHDVWNSLSFGLNYTMGIAVMPNLYAGVGIGGYTSMLDYTDPYSGYYSDGSRQSFPALYFPVFANVRWLPEISQKIHPYADLKIGYQWGVDLDDSELWVDNSTIDYYANHKNGIFIQPGVGLRFGREAAFNVGLAYNISQRMEFTAMQRDQSTITVPFSKNYGSIMLTFGADF